MEQIEHNDTFIAAFICECHRLIRRPNIVCDCGFGYSVTLRGIQNLLTGDYQWEIWMHGLGGPVLTCVSCSRQIVSADRRCECGLYARLQVKKRYIAFTSIYSECYRLELHQCATSEDIADNPCVEVVIVEAESISEPSESPMMELLTRRQRERAALREKAIQLRKEHSYRKTAKILGISLGKLQYLLKEG